MSDAANMMLALVSGVSLGAIFFGGLWWTIRKSYSSDIPALWYLGSMLLRSGLTLTGFYLVARGHWERLILCLLGFVAARLIVTRLTREAEKPLTWEPDTSHAP